MSRISPYSRSRQKSCVTCAEGKRRCNRQTPQCSRCLARGLECVYLNSPPTRSRQQPVLDSTCFQSFESPSESLEDVLSAFPLDDPTLLFNDAELLASWLTPSPSISAVPTLLPAGYYPEVTVIDRWSTRQLLQSIKSYPRMFARGRKTPFIHHRLYDVSLPKPMQDAFMVSACYYSRTPETEDTVLSILESKTTDLLRQNQNQSTAEGLLAAVQALIIFHTIQLFDGDVRQRAMAEQNMDTLRAWTMKLQLLAGELGPAPTWQEWIFAESVRRTVIVSVLMEGLYSMLKVGNCTIVRQLSVLPFTAGGAFWNMNTDASWRSEAHRLGSETVLYGDFARVFETGGYSGKLDAFEKLLLTPCIGEREKEILKQEDGN
ncbi:hypothetical protein P170DRAFT_436003 [Aspergillus steynii IBT 23096]|uniref:Zn(2)-C6 fungal-type domain-containing protein n=1 Tax=Aspergillus steynii IBT 23096 TaxID=1392250 RepID=A0A2I2GDG6_9EURO|nr:uncharacterized protein P170DRAFT_436003 [Aspergillus steynii IBT 23096]PLB50913.1 hypothetical protein P170DRAFT_436003 [Aspergillus steynii IBT 23096]